MLAEPEPELKRAEITESWIAEINANGIQKVLDVLCGFIEVIVCINALFI